MTDIFRKLLGWPENHRRVSEQTYGSSITPSNYRSTVATCVKSRSNASHGVGFFYWYKRNNPCSNYFQHNEYAKPDDETRIDCFGRWYSWGGYVSHMSREKASNRILTSPRVPHTTRRARLALPITCRRFLPILRTVTIQGHFS